MQAGEGAGAPEAAAGVGAADPAAGDAVSSIPAVTLFPIRRCVQCARAGCPQHATSHVNWSVSCRGCSQASLLAAAYLHGAQDQAAVCSQRT